MSGSGTRTVGKSPKGKWKVPAPPLSVPHGDARRSGGADLSGRRVNGWIDEGV
jgi:hypothetical protein